MVDRPPGSKALTQDAKISSSQSLLKLMVIYLGIFFLLLLDRAEKRGRTGSGGKMVGMRQTSLREDQESSRRDKVKCWFTTVE